MSKDTEDVSRKRKVDLENLQPYPKVMPLLEFF